MPVESRVSGAGVRVLSEKDVVMHTWCVQTDWDAPTLVGGEGAVLIDDAGRRYVDMSSLSECSNLGHQHPRVIQAIKDQADRLCFATADWGAQSRAELARRLLALSGFEGGRVFFTLGGADANEHAVKLARLASGHPHGKVITRDRSYHGASYAAAALSGDTRTADLGLGGEQVIRVPPPYCYRCPFGLTLPDCGIRCADPVQTALELGSADGIAGVLMEPSAGSNGIIAPPDYWPRLRAITRSHGVALIADEVMSGFGRTGRWFAWQRYGEAGRPDIMTLAKGLTGAHLPLGAVVVSREIASRIEGQMLRTGLTYSGHPLCCAAGLGAIDAYVEEDLISRSETLGAHLRQRLTGLMRGSRIIGDVRGEGLFAVVELVRDRATAEPLVPWGQTSPLMQRLVADGRAAGVSFAVRSNLIILAPPLVIRQDQLDQALNTLEALLAACEARLLGDGEEART